MTFGIERIFRKRGSEEKVKEPKYAHIDTESITGDFKQQTKLAYSFLAGKQEDKERALAMEADDILNKLGGKGAANELIIKLKVEIYNGTITPDEIDKIIKKIRLPEWGKEMKNREIALETVVAPSADELSGREQDSEGKTLEDYVYLLGLIRNDRTPELKIPERSRIFIPNALPQQEGEGESEEIVKGRDITIDMLRDFLKKNPTPQSFERNVEKVLKYIREHNTPEKEREYRTTLKALEKIIYGKRFAYWQQAKRLLKESDNIGNIVEQAKNK